MHLQHEASDEVKCSVASLNEGPRLHAPCRPAAHCNADAFRDVPQRWKDVASEVTAACTAARAVKRSTSTATSGMREREGRSRLGGDIIQGRLQSSERLPHAARGKSCRRLGARRYRWHSERAENPDAAARTSLGVRGKARYMTPRKFGEQAPAAFTERAAATGVQTQP